MQGSRLTLDALLGELPAAELPKWRGRMKSESGMPSMGGTMCLEPSIRKAYLAISACCIAFIQADLPVVVPPCGVVRGWLVVCTIKKEILCSQS